MICYVDTSAIFALLDADDEHHTAALERWTKLLNEDAALVCSNYVLVEVFALMQARLGMDAVREVQTKLMPMLNIEWIDEAIHQAGVSALMASGKKGPSLVDFTSFEIMRRLELEKVFAFDRHFKDAGFNANLDRGA